MKREDKALVFMTFNITINHIFPENFIEIPPVVLEDTEILYHTILLVTILTIFISLLDFSRFLCSKETNDVSM